MENTKKETVIVLRTCEEDGTSHGGFQWPLEVGAVATAPDWKPTAECGNGLHGLAEGDGDWSLLDWGTSAKAMLVETDKASIINIGGKVKFRSGIVRKIATLGTLLCEVFCSCEKINLIVKRIKDEAGVPSDPPASGDYSQLAASGGCSKLAASGEYSQLSASGDASKLAASGRYSHLAASGSFSELAASGRYSHLAASGYTSKLVASGDSSKLSASGDYSQLAASGDCPQLSASGDASKLVASGGCSKLAASGRYSHLAASGYASKLVASGDSSKLAASGEYSRLAASGECSQLAAPGDYSVVAAVGKDSLAMAGENGAICLTWRDGRRTRFVTGYVGEGGIKANTWYKAGSDGKLIEVGKEKA